MPLLKFKLYGNNKLSWSRDSSSFFIIKSRVSKVSLLIQNEMEMFAESM